MTTIVPQKSMTPKAWILLLLLSAVWGASFLGNRVALEEVGVLSTVAWRVTGGALALWLWIAVRRIALPTAPGVAWRLAVMGILNNVIPFCLIVWGQQHVESGLASILNAFTAVLGVLVVALVFPDERLTPRKAIGVALGFGGVATTIGVGALADINPQSLGQIAILGATLSYAVSGAFGRRAIRGVPPEVAAAGMLTAAALIMVPAALIVEGPPAAAYAPVTWAALAYLAFAASALAYLLYFMVLALAGAGNLGLVTLLIPPFAVVFGALAYHEALEPRAFAGFTLLVLGLLVIDGRLRLPCLKKSRDLGGTSG